MRPGLLINAKWKTHPRTTGVQRYAHGLTEAMRSQGMPFTLARPPSSNRFRAMLWEQRTLPRIAKGYDTLLCPANMAPPNLDPTVQLLVTIHCLRFLSHQEDYTPAFVRWYRRMIPKIIERADCVLTVSRVQQAEIETRYPAALGKIEVMPPGVDPIFRPGHPLPAQVSPEPYLLFLGSSTPAKNLAMLARAYAMTPDLPRILLAGVSQREAEVICPPEILQRVTALGHIDDPQRIAALLCNAQCLLVPSKYESFGLPCLEAMACATPVIASDLPAHREVCQDAALLVAPDDTESWSEHMRAISHDPGLRERLSRAGLERSRAFSWSSSLSTLGRLIDADTGARAR